MKLVAEGKTKKVLFDEGARKYFLEFKDDITAFNMVKHEKMKGKGELNCGITAILFEVLKKNGIPMAYVKKIDEKTIEVRDVKMIPVEVVVRNRAYGSFLKRFNFKEGEEFKKPLVEFFFKDDEKNDPQLTRELFEFLDIANEIEIKKMKAYALKINEILKEIFKKIDIVLVDFKIEFGKNNDNNIILADEIDPDSCRLWGKNGEMYDKERYRKGLDGVMEHYNEILNRLKKSARLTI